MKLGWTLTDHWPLDLGRSEVHATPDRNKKKCFLHMRVFSRVLVFAPVSGCHLTVFAQGGKRSALVYEEEQISASCKKSQWNDIVPGDGIKRDPDMD